MAQNLFTHPPCTGTPLIAPSILSADFGILADECAHALKDAGGDLLHVDIMDGHFVPNVTMGPALVAGLRAHLPDAFLDVHLMVTDPIQYVGPFADAGANHLTFHVEPSLDPRAGKGMSPLSAGYDVRQVADAVRARGMCAGLALNPPTPVEAVLPFAKDFDLILVMSVNPGFSGQKFIDESLEKTRRVRAAVGAGVRVEMDGGIGPANAARVREAGCDVIVAATAVFGVERARRAAIVSQLRGR